jgi:K+ transporter
MTFDFGETLNKFIDSCLQNETIASIAASPIYTALVIAAVMVCISLLVFDAPAGQVARFGFWSAVAVAGIMFLHNRVILYEAESIRNKLGSAEVFAPAPMAEELQGYVKAVPQIMQAPVGHV